ncbi:MAG TPA: thioredoxin domain-containing protein [Candidatus Binatus sp.]|nr:thioredoxin domain-containing protein [Candidatus Binatus sp.]
MLAAAGAASAQNAGGLSPSVANSVATDPARDAALKDFLQKHFKIPSPDSIALGPAFKTPMAGLLARQLTVRNDQGQTVQATIFFDPNETKAIIGQYLDMSTDAWGRENMGSVTLSDRPTLGPADAPVTIVEFADFECPYCAHTFSVMETLVNTTYKGKIKLIFKAYPLNVHPWAMKAAEAAECARMQNPAAFWDFARYFYSNQGSIDIKNIQQNVDKIAKQQKLDAPSLKACMDSPQTEARVKQDQNDGNSIRVSSTPTFFVNGIPVVGLPDSKIMGYVIDSELANKSPRASSTNE